MIKEIHDSNFKEEVFESEEPIFVEFFATWCVHCQALAPVLEEVSNEVKGIKFVKVDIDKNPKAVNTFNIEGTPTLFVFKNGRAVTTHSGFLPKAQLIKYIEESI